MYFGRNCMPYAALAVLRLFRGGVVAVVMSVMVVGVETAL